MNHPPAMKFQGDNFRACLSRVVNGNQNATLAEKQRFINCLVRYEDAVKIVADVNRDVNSN